MARRMMKHTDMQFCPECKGQFDLNDPDNLTPDYEALCCPHCDTEVDFGAIWADENFMTRPVKNSSQYASVDGD